MAIHGWAGAVGNNPWKTSIWSTVEQQQLWTSIDAKPGDLLLGGEMARIWSYLWSKNKHNTVVSLCSWQFDVHEESWEPRATNGWPRATAVYLRKGSIMFGMRAFQPAHMEIDLVVGQAVCTCSCVAPHGMSLSLNVNSISFGSIGSISDNSSGRGVGDTTSMAPFSDNLSSEGWAASKLLSLSRSFCHLDMCPGSRVVIRDFFLSHAFLGLVKCRPIPLVVMGWDNQVKGCIDIVDQRVKEEKGKNKRKGSWEVEYQEWRNIWRGSYRLDEGLRRAGRGAV